MSQTEKYTCSLTRDYNVEGYSKFLKESTAFIKERINFEPEILITLGSGLSKLADKIDIVDEINYSEIDGFPVSTNKAHDGKFVFGTLFGKKIICMKGRLHHYEGYKMQDVVTPLRIASMLGAKTAIITNAVGAINKDYKIGDFVVLKDGITQFVESVLRGPNIEFLGDRFFDLTQMYDPEYIKIATDCGKAENINVQVGVQVQSDGPHFETAADIKMFGILGADTVGMSSVCEAVAARHLGMKVLGINFVSNMACGVTGEKISDDDVNLTSQKHGDKFVQLVSAIVEKI